MELWTGLGIGRLIGRDPRPGEDAGALWMAAMHPGDVEVYTTWLSTLQTGAADEHEYRLLGIDGVERWVLERVRVTAIENGRVFHEGLAWDVTERRMTERGLEDARRRLTELIAAIDEVVLQHEPGPNGWRTPFVGPGLERLLGPHVASDDADPLLSAASLLDRGRILGTASTCSATATARSSTWWSTRRASNGGFTR